MKKSGHKNHELQIDAERHAAPTVRFLTLPKPQALHATLLLLLAVLRVNDQLFDGWKGV
jgi:hypothetical protein